MMFKLGKVHKIKVVRPVAKESVPETLPAERGRIRQRKRWQNYVSNQIVEPLQYRKPLTLEELVEIMAIAQKLGCKVKAVGSGHSFSDIVQTTDILVDCHGLNRPIALDNELLHDEETLADRGYRSSHLVHVENGIRIRDLNNYLDKKDLALENMGGYDGQTIAGVVSTSTHGTGITLGPIADSVASIILVGEKGKVYRIEPSNGITDPVKYRRTFPDNELIQEDDFFNAVVVSMGCMGLIYSLILKVRDSFHLAEQREEIVGEKCWEDLKHGNRIHALLQANRHLEIWVNPYAINGNHGCLVTKRNIYDKDVTRLPKGSRMRRWFIENVVLRYFTSLPAMIFALFHKKTPQLIAASMRGVLDKDGYIDKSFKVMNIGNANNVRGYAGEYAVSLKNDLFIKAVDRIIELAEKNKILGEIYHTAPISLRFVRQSNAFLSMMHGEDKCLIEVPLVYQTKGRFQILDKLEDELCLLGDIRPHWGQYHNLGKESIRRLYPQLDRWLGVYKQMNTTGVFSNTFTDRCGFG
jgi:L-gulono-1,4-lactone dehydrogenase